MKTINLIVINTTAYQDEDITLVTTLTEEEIIQVIQPIVLKCREAEDWLYSKIVSEDYDNDSLIYALTEAYPNDLIQMANYDNYISV